MLGFHGRALAGIVLAWSGLLAGTVLGDEKPASLDRWGDLLPAGAVARLGTMRLRPGGRIHAMTFSPDGKLLATVDNNGVLRVWSVATGKELAYAVRQCNNAMCGLTFSADGKTLVSVSEAAALLFDDVSALSEKKTTPIVLKKPRLAIPHRGNVPALLAFLPDRKTLLSADIDGFIHVWDAGNGQEVRSFGTTAKALHRYALSLDGKTLAVAPYGQAPALWDVAAGKMIGRMPGSEVVLALAFSPDGKRLAAGIDNSDAIRLFDVVTRKEVRSFVGRKEPPLSRRIGTIAQGLAFVADGKTLVSLGGELDDTIRIWDVESGEQRRLIRGNRGDGGALALSPGGRVAAVGGSNGVVRLWELTTGKELHGDLRQGKIRAVAVSPDNRQVAVGSSDGVVRLYERATGAEIRAFTAQPQSISHLAFTPDGKALLASIAYHPAKLWDVTSGKEIRSFAGATGSVRGVMRAAFSADGSRLALAVPEPAIQIVDPANGKVLRRLGEKQLVDVMAFSPDGSKLAGGGFDRAVHLWDAASGKELWIARNSNAIASLAFAPDGDTVAAGDYNANINLLSAASGEVVRFLPHKVLGPVPDIAVRDVAFSPDGRLLAAVSGQGEVRLLETATGTEVRCLSGHRGPVWSLSFSPDGRTLVSGSFDATALVWDMTGRAFADPRQAALSDADLENLWTDLGAADGAKGYAAVWALVRSGKQGLAFLQARLPRTPDGQTVARLIVQLDDDAFAVREKASKALARMGRSVQTLLKEELAKKPSPEVRRRIEAILEKVSYKGDARLCGLRSVAALEYADLPQARTLLQRLADNDPSEEIRHAARRALKRLENAASRP